MKLQKSVLSQAVIAALAVGAAALPQQGWAQTEATEKAGRQLEEVVVTARKMEESLQNAPIAISVFSGEALEARGVTRLSDIENIAPNLVFQNNPSFGGASSAAAVYIRGIGQKEFLPTVDPGVGLYVDGIYVARSIGAILDLIEIERVEVLRGPQGTLFGRNTIGGAISLITVKPGDKLEGNVQATMGTDDRLDGKAVLNLPLTDGLYSRLSLASLNQDGYVDRESDGKDLGDTDTFIGRLALLWEASDEIDVNFAVDYTRDRENGPAVNLLGINYAGPIDPDTPPMATIHNVGANLAAGGPEAPCIIPPITGTINLAVPGCYDDRYLVGKSKTLGTAPSSSETDLWATSLIVDWQLNENLSLRSLSGYRDLDSDFGRDGDGSPFRISEFVDALDQKQYTQELQLLGNSFEGRLNWIGGLYYFKEDGDNKNTLDFTVSNFVSGGDFDNESYAAFAQGSYDLSDDWTLTLGVRYTDETKKFTPDQYIITNYFAGSGHPQLDAPFMQAGSRILPHVEKKLDFDETTPMANIRWQASDNLMAYATYSEGFKSGGFSQRVFPPQVAGATAPPGTSDLDLIPDFDPESVDSYELGFKYDNPDMALRLNGAFFYTDYDDFQIQVFTSVAPVTKNAATVEIYGGELELFWIPAESWRVEAALGVTDAEYSDIDTAETLVPENNDLERVPETTWSASLAKDFELGKYGSASARVDWSWRDEQYMDTFNTPEIAEDDYHLVNTSVSWLSSDERYSAIAGVINIGDEDYMISGIVGDAFQSYEGVFSRGREYYLTLRYNFGEI
jgi:iron complex outermembrane receptor protein